MAAKLQSRFCFGFKQTEIELNYIITMYWKRAKKQLKIVLTYLRWMRECVLRYSVNRESESLEWGDTLRMWINHCQACGYLKKKPLNKTLYNCFFFFIYLFYLVVLISFELLLFHHLLFFNHRIHCFYVLYHLISPLGFVIFSFYCSFFFRSLWFGLYLESTLGMSEKETKEEGKKMVLIEIRAYARRSLFPLVFFSSYFIRLASFIRRIGVLIWSDGKETKQ